MQRMKRGAAAMLCAALALTLTACGARSAEPIQKTNLMLDTVVTIALYDWDDTATLDLAFDEIARLEALLSVEKEGSDLDRLAKAAGQEWVTIAPETEEVLRKAKEYAQLSGGLFDVTSGPLIALWGIHDGQGHYPTQEELAQVLPLIDDDDLLVEPGRAYLAREGMVANLGAIAKGYIADRVKALLVEQGVEHAVLDLGRNILLIGGKSDGTDFRIGVQDPNAEEGALIATVAASDKSLVTSGVYERKFTYEGKTYHHILDPTTGFPVENDVASVTILSDESVDGDALSTTCLLLGQERGLALIERLPDTEALFVDKEGQITMSTGFAAYLVD